MTAAVLGGRGGEKRRDGASGLLRSREPTGRSREALRSSGARRGGEGVVVAMGTATMTASSARWCAREGSRGGNGVQGERGEVQGARGSVWRLRASRREATRQEVARGGSRRWPRPLGRAPRLASVRPPGRGGRGQGGGGGLGRPDGAGPGKWCQVSGPVAFCSVLFFSSVLFYLIYFATVLNLK